MRIINQAYETVPVKHLRQHPRNPNEGDLGALHVSIERNGFYGVLIVQKSTGYILVGNHRYVAARTAGATELPVIYVDVDETEATRIMLADNRLSELAHRDPELLATLLTEMASADPVKGLEGTGYDGDDLDQLIQDLATPMSEALAEATADALGEDADTQNALLPDSLIYAPTWNKARTARFLSIRKWSTASKRAQIDNLEALKKSCDPEFIAIVAKEIVTVLRETFGNLSSYLVCSAPQGHSAGGKHFATEVAKVVAKGLHAKTGTIFEPVEKRTKGVVTELEAKKTVHFAADPGERVVIFDDVATTGTTIESCANALKKGIVIPIVWIYSEAISA